MAKDKEPENFKGSLFAHPIVGQVFTVLSGLSFLFLAMILPIVGRAATHGSGSPGSYRTPWFFWNLLSFIGLLALSLVLALAAILSKMERRKIDNSPLPLFSVAIAFMCILLMLALFTGQLAI